MMNWWKQHGDKLFAGLTSLQLLLQGIDPKILEGMFGSGGAKWVAFGSAVVTLAHTTFVNPNQPPPVIGSKVP